MQPFYLTSTVSPQNEFSLHSKARTSPGGFLEEESGAMERIGYLSNCRADGEGLNYVLKDWDVEMSQAAKESPLCLKLQDSYPQPNGVGPEPGGPGQLTPR